MQNVLKRKNIYFDEKFAKYVHLDLFYVLDYTESFDKHIEKWQVKLTVSLCMCWC